MRSCSQPTPTEPTHRVTQHPQNRSVAIVGGGIAGLTAARKLSRDGQSVQVFDKGRGAGGRASTRREGLRQFDHGAQYCTAKEERFQRQVDSWVEEASRRSGMVGSLSLTVAKCPSTSEKRSALWAFQE